MRTSPPTGSPSEATAPAAAPAPRQASFDELGRPLREATFVVVDLETTGGAASEGGITEIGAVKVRGGQVLGEFQTLVRPEVPVPAVVQVLTGITSSMVATAPPAAAVLPSFLEFARDAVLVAHNARYDTAFLAAACRRAGLEEPRHEVVDTLALARRLIGRDEARDHKLGTLARLVGAATAPDHRALHDARATVDVLHALLERAGGLGVSTLEDLRDLVAATPAARRGKKHLAFGLPSAPGVYLFRDGGGRVLYVGTSVDVRRRVMSYFTASETRARMTEMVSAAAEVVPVVCATPLEARVRELRLIAEHAPPYNRRSKAPERATWVKLTAEAWPRLSLVRQVRDDTAAGAEYLGPFRSARAAELAVEALHEAHPLRRCTRRIPRTPPADGPGACVLAELGRCGAPCLGVARGGQDAGSYARVVEQVRGSLREDASAVLEAGRHRMRSLATGERFEEAAQVRDRLDALLRSAERAQRRAPVAQAPELLAARRCAGAAGWPGWPDGGWELVLVRHGRLAGTSLSPRGASPLPHLEALRATGEVVPTPEPGRPGLLVEETDVLLTWLEQPGVRLVSVDPGAPPWALPVRGAGWARHALGTAGAGEPVSGGPGD